MTIAEKDKAFYRYTKDHRFAAMYPLLAREIAEKYSLKTGTCLDIGTGSAAMAIELAKITDLEITALDPEAEIIEMARNNCAQHGLAADRIRFVTAPVENMPFADGSFDFILSRGSIPFWQDLATAFREIFRVLAPGGQAMAGCGFSHYQTQQAVVAMRPKWDPDVAEARMRWKKDAVLAEAMHQAGIQTYSFAGDAFGGWVQIAKPGTSN